MDLIINELETSSLRFKLNFRQTDHHQQIRGHQEMIKNPKITINLKFKTTTLNYLLRRILWFWNQLQKIREFTSILLRNYFQTKNTLPLHFFRNYWNIVKYTNLKRLVARIEKEVARRKSSAWFAHLWRLMSEWVLLYHPGSFQARKQHFKIFHNFNNLCLIFHNFNNLCFIFYFRIFLALGFLFRISILFGCGHQLSFILITFDNFLFLGRRLQTCVFIIDLALANPSWFWLCQVTLEHIFSYFFL